MCVCVSCVQIFQLPTTLPWSSYTATQQFFFGGFGALSTIRAAPSAQEHKKKPKMSPKRVHGCFNRSHGTACAYQMRANNRLALMIPRSRIVRLYTTCALVPKAPDTPSHNNHIQIDSSVVFGMGLCRTRCYCLRCSFCSSCTYNCFDVCAFTGRVRNSWVWMCLLRIIPVRLYLCGDIRSNNWVSSIRKM